MPNPNNSEMKLNGSYGENEDRLQYTDIYTFSCDDADQIEHKFLEDVPVGGRYVELAHYSEVKQVIIQNMDDTDAGIVFYADSLTGAIVTETLQPEEHVSFCVPNVVTGIVVYAQANKVSFHLAFVGVQ